MLDYLVLILAAFFAGILNTIAGGGTFLTFPALVYAGIPPVAATMPPARSPSFPAISAERRAFAAS